jgi:hypothetical protein
MLSGNPSFGEKLWPATFWRKQQSDGIYISGMCRDLLCFLLLTCSALALDIVEVMKKSVEQEQRNLTNVRQYIWTQTTEEREAGADRSKAESKTYRILPLYGRHYRRLILKNGKALTPAEDSKENEKLGRESERRRVESAEERRRNTLRDDEERLEQLAAFKELPQAFDYKYAGEDVYEGRQQWKFTVSPRAGYAPKAARAKVYQHMRGTMLVDKQDYQLTRLDSEVTSDVAFGVVLTKLAPGSRIAFSQTRQGDVWLPSRAIIDYTARFAFVKTLKGIVDTLCAEHILSGPSTQNLYR